MNDILQISEIFGPTLQGEGALIGRTCLFVRTAGCDFRCSWCDTLYAVETSYRHEWKKMTCQEVWDQIEKKSYNKPILICLSGGNPAIQPLENLIQKGRSKGYEFNLETQGSIHQKWFDHLTYLTLSPKPPSSKMTTDFNKLKTCIDISPHVHISFKCPILDEQDYQFTKKLWKTFPHIPLFFQPVNLINQKISFKQQRDKLIDQLCWLKERIHKDQWFEPIILPQLHVLMWGNQTGV